VYVIWVPVTPKHIIIIIISIIIVVINIIIIKNLIIVIIIVTIIDTSTGGRDGDKRKKGQSDRLLAVAAGVVSEDGRSGREQHWRGSESHQEGLQGRCRRRWLRYVEDSLKFAI